MYIAVINTIIYYWNYQKDKLMVVFVILDWGGQMYFQTKQLYRFSTGETTEMFVSPWDQSFYLSYHYWLHFKLMLFEMMAFWS